MLSILWIVLVYKFIQTGPAAPHHDVSGFNVTAA
jgi:hypothetical protein